MNFHVGLDTESVPNISLSVGQCLAQMPHIPHVFKNTTASFSLVREE